MSKGEYKNVHNKTHKPTYKVKIRPLFFSGLSLPNPECSSCLLNGRNFYKKYGKSSLSYQHDPSLIYSNTVSFFKTKLVDHRTPLFMYVNIRGKIPDFCDLGPEHGAGELTSKAIELRAHLHTLCLPVLTLT